eukprot:g30278.t1
MPRHDVSLACHCPLMKLFDMAYIDMTNRILVCELFFININQLCFAAGGTPQTATAMTRVEQETTAPCLLRQLAILIKLLVTFSHYE